MYIHISSFYSFFLTLCFDFFIQVLLNHICDKPIVYFSEEGILAVLPGCDGIIVRSDYIKAVLLEWRVWQKAGLAVWYASLHSILALISEPHPHSEFNISQCQKADVLHCLISVCRVSSSARTVMYLLLPVDYTMSICACSLSREWQIFLIVFYAGIK